MSTARLHAPPARQTVAWEQFRAVGLSLKAEVALFAIALLWATGAAVHAFMVDPHYLGLDMVPEVALPYLAVAFVVPLAVWKSEGPSRRAYHLAMPVSRESHQLTRNSAGLMWVLVGLAVYLLWVELMIPPAPISIAVEQIRLVGLALRPVLITWTALLLLFVIVVLTDPSARPVDFLPNRFGRLLFLLVLLAPAVWRHDEPTRRGYLLTMPVNRLRLLLMRSGAGWLWTMALVAGTLGVLLTLSLMTGGEVAIWQPGLSFPPAGWTRFQQITSALAELDLPGRQPLPTWQLAVSFVAATVAFSIGNAVAIARNNATLWIIGGYLGCNALTLLTERSAPGLHEWLMKIVDGRYGLDTLFSGNTRELVHTLQLSFGPVPVQGLTPDPAAWLGSVLLWLSVAAIATAAALRNQRAR